MIYHRIAVNVPLSDGLLTYSHSEPLPPGTRVLVPFRNKTVVGMVWETDIAPDMDAARILSVQTVFVEEKPLSQSWRDLLAFTSRYYHYPTGQAVFAALPQGLKETRAVEMPQPPLFYALNEAGRAQTPPPARFNKKAALWDALLSGEMTMAALKQANAQAAKLIEDWAEQGWIETTEAAKPVLRPYRGQASHSEFVLNTGQQKASDEIQTALGRFRSFLLYGITGSGKTEVYFDAMAKVLAQGRQVLFLLPEINLTPQLLKRVENRFADVPTAVLHSRMAAGRRTQDYLRAMLGQAKLVIGTRLAVFTPLPDVGLIVVDEEHDGSFKQDNELRYHARDLAVWRAKQGGCPVVLGSATPSLESWHKAQSGAYRLLQLTERAHASAQLPQVDILNIGRLKLDNGFSPQALQLLKQNFEAGGMSLVYLNRRGFAPALFCGDCGHTFGCPNCSAKMVLHQRARQLRCHHCDHREPIPFKCPDCGNQDLTAVGHGT
ncbi:replication restart helicase PriA, partial [Neisseria gonorrhoeae]